MTREGDALCDATRRAGSRNVIFAAALAATVGLCLGPALAPAQGYRGGGGIGPGSTVQGDILRGEGIAALGMGQYNLSTAMATSINTDTAIRWNQYVYLSIEEDLHKKYLHRMAHKERTDTNYRKNLQRILDKPEQADVRTGGALNFVLMQLLDPRISPSSYRNAKVPLSGDTIRKIPFQYASRAATFSMERLIGKREWPLSLRGEAFAKARKAYERAIDSAIELDVEGKLTGDAVRGIQEAVRDLGQKVEENILQSRTDDYKQAKNYLKRLDEVPRILKEGAVERVIAEIETYPGTCVGDLLGFMQRHNLRFGVAESLLENELYANLFTSLRQQRELMPMPADPQADQPNR
jgi:hypothetical protein